MTAQSKWTHSSILDWFVNEEKKNLGTSLKWLRLCPPKQEV